MSAWRTADLRGLHGALRWDSRARKLLAVPEGGDAQPVCLTDVAVLIAGPKVTLEPSVVQKLAEKDISCLLCDWRGAPMAGLVPYGSSHGRICARQRAQADASLPRRKSAWKAIVRAKIAGQANNLEWFGLEGSARSLCELAKSVRSGDPKNVEGQAARVYWRALFRDDEFRRTPGVGDDCRNGALDYSYTVLRTHAMRAVAEAGLVPSLGVFHRSRGNAFALADDLMEPFRPAVDLAVARLPQPFDPADREIRKTLVKAAEQTFESTGATVPTSLTALAQRFGRYLERETANLEVLTWDPIGL